MEVDPETAIKITMACVSLHNLMRIRYPGLQNAAVDRVNENHVEIPGTWRIDGALADSGQTYTSRERTNAKQQRNDLRDYVNGPYGSVPWQDAMIRQQPRN